MRMDHHRERTAVDIVEGGGDAVGGVVEEGGVAGGEVVDTGGMEEATE